MNLLGGRVVAQINRLIAHRHRVIVTVSGCEICLVALTVWSGCRRVVSCAGVLVDEDEVIHDVFEVDRMSLSLSLVQVVVEGRGVLRS